MTVSEIYGACSRANDDAKTLVRASEQLGYAVSHFLEAVKAFNDHCRRFDEGLSHEEIQPPKIETPRRGEKSKRSKNP